MPLPAFRFKKFRVEQDGAAHPVGTDAVLLGAWADLSNTQRFLDIGTGTGVMALMLAQRLAGSEELSRSSWSGVGVELHPGSALLARGNYVASPWGERLSLWEGRIQEFGGGIRNSDSLTPSETITINKPFDLIISNPPYFSELTISPDKTRSLGRHTASLSPGDLLAAAHRWLAPDGRFCVILPEREGRRLCELAVPEGLYWTKIAAIRSRPGKPVERLLIQFEKSPYAIQMEEFSIYASEKGDAYSEAFRALTGDFYLAG
jgi:tRNA1Val (adenine37-N6)-methyltransferase